MKISKLPEDMQQKIKDCLFSCFTFSSKEETEKAKASILEMANDDLSIFLSLIKGSLESKNRGIKNLKSKLGIND